MPMLLFSHRFLRPAVTLAEGACRRCEQMRLLACHGFRSMRSAESQLRMPNGFQARTTPASLRSPHSRLTERSARFNTKTRSALRFPAAELVALSSPDLDRRAYAPKSFFGS